MDMYGFNLWMFTKPRNSGTLKVNHHFRPQSPSGRNSMVMNITCPKLTTGVGILAGDSARNKAEISQAYETRLRRTNFTNG